MTVERNENRDREPVHPGRILADYMDEKGWNQTELAGLIDISRPHLNEIINGKRGISSRMAVKLAIAFDTTQEFWKNLDTKRQLWEARRKNSEELDKIQKRIEDRADQSAA
ncbi:MAG: HigA family addiction module antitoxin [bacterium]